MNIYLKDIPAKFHPDAIWNDGDLGFLLRGSLQQEQEQDEYWYRISFLSLKKLVVSTQ